MTRQEMEKLLAVLDHKTAGTYIEEVKKALDELSRVVDTKKTLH